MYVFNTFLNHAGKEENLDSTELKNINVISKFTKFQVINKDFTRCRCNVFYTGRNRNYSDITEEALQKFIARKGYANVPVVAHLMKDDDGNYRVGGHDGKIVISSEGIEFVDECVPFGVIPEDCNPSMDVITEKSGEQRKYFSVDIILWTHRYPIMEASYDDEIYFNQSMEISFDDYSYDRDYIVVNDFSMSALCLLNKSNKSSENVEPCFESSMVKKFSIDENKFKQNFELLLDTLKQYESGENPVQNKNKEGVQQMELKKFVETLSQVKIGETDNAKYRLLSISEEKVFALDLEDYKAYGFNYAVTSEEDNEELVIDFDSKCEMSLSACEKITEDGFEEFSIADTMAEKVESEVAAKMEAYTNKLTEEFNVKYDEMKVAFEELDQNYKMAMTELATFKEADATRKEKEHKEAIDSIVNDFSKKLGRVPEFLIYKARLDYSKTVDEVQKELTLMAGKSVMDNQTKANFAYTPVSTTLSKNNKKTNTDSSRYGHLLDKFM